LANKAFRPAAHPGPADWPPSCQEQAGRWAARPPRKIVQIGRPAAMKMPAGPAGEACRPGPHLKAAAKGSMAWPMQSRAGLAAEEHWIFDGARLRY